MTTSAEASQRTALAPHANLADQAGRLLDEAGLVELVAALSLPAKVRLLTGADNWATHAVEAIGLRPIILSDGPSGARGVTLDELHPSTCLPCPSALGATWNPDLVRDLAAALGAEARSKGIDVLLAPTVNVMRTPLGGRGFECFAEDPVLTAAIAVSYVRGLQSAGVAATAKHYVCNDSETERWTYDVRISEQALSEIYLAPFEACVRDADVGLVMAAYNKVNGVPMTENHALLTDVLKGEWGFTGVVTSDWNATRSTVPTALGGLDLAMPGPDGPWGDRLVQAVDDGLVDEAVIDDKVLRLLRLARRVGALPGEPEPDSHQAPNGGRPAGPSRDAARLIDPVLLRQATAASFVLLRNAGDALPLSPESIGRLAIIGPGGVRPTLQGVGSPVVAPVTVSTPAQALARRLAGQADVSVAEGCQTWVLLPEPPPGSLRDPDSGEPGLRQEFRSRDGAVLSTEHRNSATLTWWDRVPAEIGWGKPGSIVLRTLFTPTQTGPHLLGAAGVGRLTVSVDGKVIADQPTVTPADPVQAMTSPGQVTAAVHLRAKSAISVRLEFRPAADGHGPISVRLGIVPVVSDDELLVAATEAARTADAAVVVVGSAEMTEAEGFDRPSLRLPGRQDELVSRVAAVCPGTIVVVNSGMPVLLPWADQVAAVIQAWLPGEAFGEALADVLVGQAEPGGRLPVTIPASADDCPVLHATPVGGRLEYAEDLFVGYRGYDAAGIEPAFPFGHGLGYTTWAYEAVDAAAGDDPAQNGIDIRVRVRNTGSRPGREVVQVYLAGGAGEPGRPQRTLVAFGTAAAGPGQSTDLALRVPARELQRSVGGVFSLLIGRSSSDIRLSLDVPRADRDWRG